MKEICKRLRELENRWPKGGLMIMANGNFLYLCTKHPQDGGRVIESFGVPNDGGDPDWTPDNERDDERPKRLVKFRPPPSQTVHHGPRPDFTGKRK